MSMYVVDTAYERSYEENLRCYEENLQNDERTGLFLSGRDFLIPAKLTFNLYIFNILDIFLYIAPVHCQ